MSERDLRRPSGLKVPSQANSSTHEEAGTGDAPSRRTVLESSASVGSDAAWESEPASEDYSEYDEFSGRLSDEGLGVSTATDDEYSNASKIIVGQARQDPSKPVKPRRLKSPRSHERVRLKRRLPGPQYDIPYNNPFMPSQQQVRDFEPPFRVEDPSSILSAVVSLRGLRMRSSMRHRNQPGAQPWNAAKSTLPSGAKTTCLTILEVKHYADDAGDSLITLVCYDTASVTTKESVQARWMHVRQEPSMTEFEDVIDSCPYASPDLRTVALMLLRDWRHSMSSDSESFQGDSGRRDFIMRYDHRYHEEEWGLEPVVFMSVPFFTKKTTAWLERDDMTPMSATPIRYHVHPDHDFAAADAEMSSKGSVTSREGTASEICVAYLWCLLLGQDIIFTCGDIELKDLLEPNMTVEMESGENRSPCAVRIVDSDSRYYHFVINLPLSYVDFIDCVVNKVRLFDDASNVRGFKLFTEGKDELTPETWLGLMQREELDSLGLLLHRGEGLRYSSDSAAFRDEGEPNSLRSSKRRGTEMIRGERVFIADSMRGANPKVLWEKSLVVNASDAPPMHTRPAGGYGIIQATIGSDDSECEKSCPESEQTSTKLGKIPTTSASGSALDQPLRNIEAAHASHQPVRKVTFDHNTFRPPLFTSTGSTACANGRSDSVPPTVYPFFTWSVVHQRDDGGKLPSHVQIYQLLNRVDKVMARKRPGLDRYVYQRGFECNLAELGYRHPYLTGTLRGTVMATSAHRDAKTTDTGVEGDSRQPATDQKPNFQSPSSQLSLSWEVVVKQYLCPLASLTLEIGNGFIPAELEVVHRCWKKLWGAVDRILRSVETHYKLSPAEGRYRVSERIYTASLYRGSWEDTTKGFILECQTCREGTEYKTLKLVLDHLHERHTQCQDCGKPARLSDDPCTVWVEGMIELTVQDSIGPILRDLGVFILYLQDVRRSILELQRSVQHVDSPSSRKQSERRLPQLPSTLVQGFEELLLSYITFAHILSRSTAGNEIGPAPSTKHSLRTRNIEGVMSDPYETRSSRTYGTSHIASSFAARGLSKGAKFDIWLIYQQSMAQAKSRLKHAQRDLILLSATTGRAGSVSLAAVGAEYILGVVLAGLNTHIDGRKEDLLGLYSRKLVKVGNQAARRPRRQHFMEMHGIETDVLAVGRVFRLHSHMLGNYERILNPCSYRFTTKARQKLYEVEAKFLSEEANRLSNRIRSVDFLLTRLNFFKQRIKQQIEVLDEGHGKAIRVFTFVTAFFLPLSFVTSFLGMNTTDIRDTNLDQSIFWKVAIPTTILILTLAFLYGYKWDSIRDSLGEMWEMTQQKRAQRRVRRRAGRDGDSSFEALRWQFSSTRSGRKLRSDSRSDETKANGLGDLPV